MATLTRPQPLPLLLGRIGPGPRNRPTGTCSSISRRHGTTPRTAGSAGSGGARRPMEWSAACRRRPWHRQMRSRGGDRGKQQVRSV